MEAAERLKTDLIRRGYDEETTSNEINRAAVLDRSALRVYKEKVNNN